MIGNFISCKCTLVLDSSYYKVRTVIIGQFSGFILLVRLSCMQTLISNLCVKKYRS